MAAKGTGVPAQNHRTVATVSSPQRSGELDEILNDLLRETPAEASVRERTLAKSWGTREREFSAPQGCVSTQSGGSQTVLTWQTSRDGPRKCVTVSKETVRRPTPGNTLGNTLGNSLQQHGGVTGSRFTDERSLLDVVDGRRFQDPPSYQESRTLQTHTETKTRERVLSPVFRRPVAGSDRSPRVPPAPPDRRRVLSPEIMSDGTVLSAAAGYSSPLPQGQGHSQGQGKTYTLPQHQTKRSVTSHRNYASDSEEALTWLEEQRRKLEQRRAGRSTTMNHHRLQYHTTDRSRSSTDFTRTLPGGGSRPAAPVFPPSDVDDFVGPKSQLPLKNSLSADGLNRAGKAASSGFYSAPRTTDVPRFAKDYGDVSRFRSVENRGRDDRFYHVSSIQRPSSATPHTKYSFTMPAGGSRPGLSAPTSPVIPVRGVSSRDAVIRSQGKASEWFGVAENATYDRLDDADDTLRKSSGGVHLTAPLKPVTTETELISLRPIGPGVRDLEPGGTVDGTLNFRRSTPALNRISQDYSHGKSQGELRSQSSLGRSTLMVSPESQRRDLNSYATLPISTVRSSALRDSYVFAPIQRPFTSLGPAPQSNDSGSFQSSQRRLYSTEAVHGSLGGSRQPVYDVQQPGHAWSSTGQQQTMSQQWLKQQQPLPQQQQFSQQEVQYRQQVQQQQKQLLIQEQLRQLDLQHEQQKQLQLQEQQRQLQLQEQQRQLIQQQEQQRLLQLQEQQRQLQQQQEEQRQLQLQEQQRLLQQQQEQQRLLQLQEQQRQLQQQEEQRQLQLQEQQRQLQQQQEQQRLLQLQEQQRQLQQQQEEQRQLQLQEQQRQLQQQQEQQRLLQLQEQQRQQEEQRQLQIQEQQRQLQIQEHQRQLQQQLEEQRQLQIQEQQRQLQQQLEEQRQLQQRQQEQLVAQQKQLQQQQEEQRQLQLQEQQRQLLQQQEQQRQLIQQQEQQRQLIQQQEQQRQLQQHQQLLHSQTIQRMYVVEEKTQLGQGQGPPLTTQTLDSRVRGASFTSGQPVSEFTSQETFQKTAFVEPPRSNRSDAVVQLESSRRNESVTGSSSNQYTSHQSGSSSQAVQVQGVGLNQTTGQVGANQVGLNQVGVNKVGLNQVGVNQVGLSQTGGQVGLNQVGVNQVGLNQTVGQVGANQTGQMIERRYVVEREVVGKGHTGDQVIINQTGGQVGMNQVGTTQPTGGGQVGRQVIEQRYTVERQVIGKGLQGAQQVGTTSLSSGLADANQGQKTHAVEAGQVAYQTAYQGGNQTAYQSGNQIAYQSGTQIGTQQAVHQQGDKYQTGTVEKSTLVQSAGGTQGERYVQQAGTANQQHSELRFGGGGGAVTTGGGNKVLTSPGGSQRIEIISTESGDGQQQHHLQQQSQQQQQQEQHSYAYGFQQVGERSDGAGWTLERGGATNDGRATTSASHQTVGSMNPGGSWTLRPEVSRSGGHQRNASGSFVDGRQASPRFDLGRSRTSSTTCLPDGFAEWSHQPPHFVRDTSQYWHKPNISRDDAISLLLDKEPGSFVVRNSSTFPGSFGLALKVSQVPPNMQTKGGDPQVDLIRHFLIEPTPNGVRLKGCSNEPVFASLSSLIYQHSMTPLSLPCRLKLPDEDTLDSAAASNSQLNGAACTVLYMSSVETENLTGPEALARSIKDLFESGRSLPRSTIVQLKVTRDGITLTDNRRKIFFRRFYPIQTVTFCGVDPRDRRWTVRSEDITISGKAFGFVARKPGVTRENACHVFLELDPTQPATTIVNFVSKVLIGQGQRLIQ